MFTIKTTSGLSLDITAVMPIWDTSKLPRIVVPGGRVFSPGTLYFINYAAAMWTFKGLSSPSMLRRDVPLLHSRDHYAVASMFTEGLAWGGIRMSELLLLILGQTSGIRWKI